MEKIVYVYNWKDLIMITRDSKGNWKYHYTPINILQAINKKRRKRGERPYGRSMGDVFEVGTTFGVKIIDLVRRCQISYGDAPEINDLT